MFLKREWKKWLQGLVDTHPEISEVEYERASEMLRRQLQLAYNSYFDELFQHSDTPEDPIGLYRGKLDTSNGQQTGDNRVHFFKSPSHTVCSRDLSRGTVDYINLCDVATCGGPLCLHCFSSLPHEVINFQRIINHFPPLLPGRRSSS